LDREFSNGFFPDCARLLFTNFVTLGGGSSTGTGTGMTAVSVPATLGSKD